MAEKLYYFSTVNNRLFLFDPLRGPLDYANNNIYRQAWSQLANDLPTCPPTLHNDGMLYVGSTYGWILKFPPSSGKDRVSPVRFFSQEIDFGETTDIDWIVSWNQKLWFSATRGSGNTRIYSTNGLESAVVDSGVSTARCMLIPFGTRLVQVYEAATNIVRWSDASGAGATTLSMPSTGFGWKRNSLIWSPALEYKGKLYIAGTSTGTNKATIYQLTTAGALTEAHGLSTNASAYPGNLMVLGGYLYYSWYNGTTFYLGRFDGSTWSDTYVNLTTVGTASVGACRFKGSILVFNGSGTAYISDGETVAGTWSAVTTPADLSGGADEFAHGVVA